MSPRSAAPLTLEFILLGLVSKKPAHGYELQQELRSLQSLSQVWHIGQPQLYALIDKLERQGLLTGELQPGEGRPDRKVLSLTPTGRQMFDAWLSTPVEHPRDMRQEFLAKLFFARQAGFATELIVWQREVCQKWLGGLNHKFEMLTPDQMDERLVFQLRILQVRALLEWLDQAAVWVGNDVNEEHPQR
ncbi:predicted transcriptional regulator [Longilinea arvoryzae]|uniref:Predicted transcriptional regulator n=1 Tax=Longilinea arvoryzae TaxID=360412 RepID=A0A0S7BKH9_9CHLR|nr:PadR family transcriptional regulator [Longilinea arvoryzae]GAP14325.1 predicted transcriptional regulator [Longilinea arvoryzae]